MQILELFNPTPDNFRSEKDDKSVYSKTDTRKTRLTLARIHKLRIINDARKLEKEKEVEELHTMYKPAAPDAGGGLGL